MARIISFTWVVLAVAIVQAKPLDSSIDSSINEVDQDNARLRRKEQARNSALPTNEEEITGIQARSDATNSAAGTVIDATVRPLVENPTIKPGPFSWFLTPLTQNIQFSPHSLLQDRLLLLKEALNKLGINPPQNATMRQLGGPSGLLHFVGPNDTGFYTNRLDPAGFLGGNGWFANKGGILGGPGAIVSTGSLLTDYPTPYRRK